MRHRAAAKFWAEYRALPEHVRERANRQFELLKANPQHPSLQFKKVEDWRGQEIWSARVTLTYRAPAVKRSNGYLWFWIGEHKVYDLLIS
jgi:hypothetical protein